MFRIDGQKFHLPWQGPEPELPLIQLSPSCWSHPASHLLPQAGRLSAEGWKQWAWIHIQGNSRWQVHSNPAHTSVPSLRSSRPPWVGTADLIGGSGVSVWAGGSPTGQALEKPRVPWRKCLVLSYPCQGRHRIPTKSLFLVFEQLQDVTLRLLVPSYPLLLILI